MQIDNIHANEHRRALQTVDYSSEPSHLSFEIKITLHRPDYANDFQIQKSHKQLFYQQLNNIFSCAPF